MNAGAQDAAAVERFLAHFHDRAPGGSPRAFAPVAMADDTGIQHASSYHALAAALHQALDAAPHQALAAASHQALGAPLHQAPGAAPSPAPSAAALPAAAGPAPASPADGHAAPVLDLACGDGHLLRLLRATRPGQSLLGADLSSGELAAARARGLDGVALLQARAQHLPLPDASLAALTCHMALMLMSPAEVVLAEAARVLRPGGWLLAVLPRPPQDRSQPPAVYRAFDSATRGMAVDPRWAAVRFQGRRWCQPDALGPLLQAAGFTAARWQPLDATLRLDVQAAWDWVREMYDIRLLGDAVDAQVQPRFAQALTPLLDASGHTPLPHALWLLRARRAA